MFAYAFTIFLGAFLLFLVQPLIGKFILPWFGGAAGTWAVCLLFFQTGLLAGYAYAHLIIRRLSPRWQALVHVGLLLGSLAFLPIIPDAAWKPTGGADPTWRILALLTACLGVPYVALSATGPLLQAWFARTHAAASPYRLYALSNAGSLLALLGYPFVMEPALTRSAQAWTWSGGLIAFAALCGYCAVRAGQTQKRRNAETQKRRNAETPKLPTKRPPSDFNRQSSIVNRQSSIVNRQSTGLDRWLWVLLPACASVMLLSVTNKIGEEIAPVPFLWVLPLATYLLTFIIAFEWPRLYWRPVFLVAVLLAPWLVLLTVPTELGIRTQVSAYLIMLFSCCMVCHGEVYRLRPAAQQLTGYYLAIAAGGALGGAFVSLAAPLIFSSYLELYIGLFGSVILLLACMFNKRASMFHGGARRLGWLVLAALMAGAGLAVRLMDAEVQKNAVLRTRNFYGVLTLRSHDSYKGDAKLLKLEHGRTVHGAQIIHPELRHWPALYYAPSTAAGMVFRLMPHQRPRTIGVVGLGVGTLAAYGEPGDVFHYYEINPKIQELARTRFTYLEDSQATVDVIMGDARLSLEREPPQHFDVLVLDAFSGDAIPMHLLTVEAFALYQHHMDPDGLILVHITNRYLDLQPVLQRLAEHDRYDMRVVHTPEDRVNLIPEANWVLLTRNPLWFELPEIKEAAVKPGQASRRVRLWTDDDANLFEILR